MNPIRILPLLTALAALPLSGCVIHVGGGEGGRHGSYDSVEKREERNREALGRLALGTPLEQVLDQLGEPDFTEVMSIGGREVRILRYRTHRAHADGDTSRDETTPLVFKDGKLTGIGEGAATAALNG